MRTAGLRPPRRILELCSPPAEPDPGGVQRTVPCTPCPGPGTEGPNRGLPTPPIAVGVSGKGKNGGASRRKCLQLPRGEPAVGLSSRPADPQQNCRDHHRPELPAGQCRPRRFGQRSAVRARHRKPIHPTWPRCDRNTMVMPSAQSAALPSRSDGPANYPIRPHEGRTDQVGGRLSSVAAMRQKHTLGSPWPTKPVRAGMDDNPIRPEDGRTDHDIQDGQASDGTRWDEFCHGADGCLQR